MGIDITQLNARQRGMLRGEDRKSLGIKSPEESAELAAKREGLTGRQIQDEIIRWCNLNSYPAFWSRTDKRTGRPVGEPDLEIALPGGKTAWIEVKGHGDRLSPEQIQVIERLQGLGHLVMVATSVPVALDWLKYIINNGDYHHE